MMNDFFMLGENVIFPNPMGTFSGKHLLVLFLSIIFAIWMVRDYKKSENKAKYRRIFAIIILLVVLSRHVIEFFTGQYTVHRLPLHLCTIGAILKLYDAYVENDYSKEVLFVLTLPAAAIANVFPDWTHQPLINFNTGQQFLFHALLVNYVLMRYCAGEIKPSIKKMWMPVSALIAMLILLMPINRTLGTNFFFFNTYSPNSPLEIIYLQMGSSLYLPTFLFIKIMLGFLIYAILGICRKILYKSTSLRID